MRPYLLLCSAAFLALTLLGCSHLSPTQQANDVEFNNAATLYYNTPQLGKPQAPVVYRPIPADTLYSLLLAEIAGQRQLYDVALHEYLTQAQKTKDPAITERALRIAQFTGNKEKALEALDLWLNENPNAPLAHQAAAGLQLELGNIQAALAHLQEIQKLTSSSQYDYLAASAGDLSLDNKEALLHELENLSQAQPKNNSLLFAIALMHQHLKQYPKALEKVEEVLDNNADLLSAKLQKARLLVLLKRHDEALSWLEKLRKSHPENKSVQVLYARILLELNRLEPAREAFVQLNQNFPDDPAILLSLALLNDETGHKTEARSNFYQLLGTRAHNNDAHFYLGRLADEEGNAADAVLHFSQVVAGREFVPAQLRATFLINQDQGLQAARQYLRQQREAFPEYSSALVRIEVEFLNDHKDYKEALTLLNAALKQEPNNIDLLYSRAMTAERANKLKIMEQDLRDILAKHPDNVDALNALGYTLADRTERWNEALPFIRRAFELAPNNPAVIDSLGWVYFRLGDIERARPLLEEAFRLIQDHEIAAHLGELLWITGSKFQAAEVWQKGFKQHPQSEIILKTLQRLHVNQEEFNLVP